MNEIIDTENILEIEKPKKDHDGDSDEETHEPVKKGEEEQKYHESVIQDVYGDMSDSEEEDEEETQQKLHQQIQEEAKQKTEEIKMQKINQSLTSKIQFQVMETVNKAVENAKAYQSEIKLDKAKGLFTQAFTKFNQIVEKNKVNLPEININELMGDQKEKKSSLNQYLKNKSDISISQQNHKSDQEREKKENFKIGEDGSVSENASVGHSEQELEGEEFSDSEDNNQQQTKENSENKEEEKELINAEKPKEKVNEQQQQELSEQEVQEYIDHLAKGKQIDVTNLKLYQIKKDTSDKSVIYNLVHSYDTRHIAILQGHLISFQMVQNQSTAQNVVSQINAQKIKENLNAQQIKKMATSWFQKSKEKLMNLKNGTQSLPQQQLSPENPLDAPDDLNLEKEGRKFAMMKGLTKVERLYMIDIVEKGKKEIEVIMHFVNKQYNPMMSPVIKKYRMPLDETTQQFLINLQREIEINNSFFKKVNDFKADLHGEKQSQ